MSSTSPVLNQDGGVSGGGGGSGTEYTEGDIVAAADGGVMLAKQSDNTLDVPLIDSSRRLTTTPRDMASDDITIAGQFDDASTSTASEDQVALVRITEYRGLHVNLRNASGSEISPATAANQTTANTSLSSIDGKITACNTGAVVLAAGTASIGKLAANSGVDIGDVDITSTVPPTPSASIGGTPYKLISAASTNATSVKSSAGVVHSVCVSNTNASVRYVKIYDKASAPTVGTDTPVHVIMVPSGGGNNQVFNVALKCTNGIALAMTTGAADSDTGAVAASEIIANMIYT